MRFERQHQVLNPVQAHLRICEKIGYQGKSINLFFGAAAHGEQNGHPNWSHENLYLGCVFVIIKQELFALTVSSNTRFLTRLTCLCRAWTFFFPNLVPLVYWCILSHIPCIWKKTCQYYRYLSLRHHFFSESAFIWSSIWYLIPVLKDCSECSRVQCLWSL